VHLTLPTVRVAMFLVENADDRHWLQDACRRTGLQSGAVHPILRRMLDAGWLVDEWEGDDPRPPARRYYRVTVGGRRELEGLLSRARGDARFTHLFAKPPTPTFQPPRHGRAQA
jgi:DNA-binding PadR family transcriptional regulator